MCPSYGGVRYERVDYNPQANPKVVDSIPTEVQAFFSQLAWYLIPFNLHDIFVCYFHRLAKTVPSFLKCGGKMSVYFCPISKHFISVDENPYHCEKCDICR